MAPYARFSWGKGVAQKSAETIFYAAVADLDAQIGRLLDGLDKLGAAGNTLILFSSDNGPEDIHIINAGHSGVGSAGPFRGRKRSLYEGGVRVPFLGRRQYQFSGGGSGFSTHHLQIGRGAFAFRACPRWRRHQRGPAG
jgi:arylsulfatase A-like enzyme